jgi:hypothetical protein
MSSIHPPPEELWQDLGIEDMIEKFNEESRAPPTRKGASRTITPPAFGAPAIAGSGVFTSAVPATPATNEGTLGRFSRVWASVFGDFRNVLGKRKAGQADAERDKENHVLDERKQAAEQAYQARKLAQEQGLLPTPKVFVRPTATPRSHKHGIPAPNLQISGTGVGLTPAVVELNATAATPRTPGLYRSPSKKDLLKQKKLVKRVSSLEVKLASARKELHTVLAVPPVPLLSLPLPNTPLPPTLSTPVPETLPDTPITSQSTQVFSDNEISQDTQATSPAPSQHVGELVMKRSERAVSEDIDMGSLPPSRPVGKITKKRKVTTTDDETYKPLPTDSEVSDIHSASEPERTIKRAKSTSTTKKLKRQPSRLTKRSSRSEMRKEEAVTVVPDGENVPPMPKLPNGVKAGKVRLREGDDGYGGLEHEMF